MFQVLSTVALVSVGFAAILGAIALIPTTVVLPDWVGVSITYISGQLWYWSDVFPTATLVQTGVWVMGLELVIFTFRLLMAGASIIRGFRIYR